MYSIGTWVRKIVWVGQSTVMDGVCVIDIEDDDGKPVMFLGTGALVPQNWIGRRVKITIEDRTPPEVGRTAARVAATALRKAASRVKKVRKVSKKRKVR